MQLKGGPYSNYYNLLNLFAYGSCSDYKGIFLQQVFLHLTFGINWLNIKKLIKT